MIKMYKGMVNSPATSLVESINAETKDIKIVDGAYFPKGENLAVIGTEGNAETIKYSDVNENVLVSCVRGFQGEAKDWEKDTLIARNFTEYDLSSVQENIGKLNTEKASNTEFKDFKTDIQKQLDDHETQAAENLKPYAKKTELTAVETSLDKKINTKLPTSTFEDFKNTNKIELDKKTNNTDFTTYKKEVITEFGKKVDKVSGKGLSTNDYDNTEKAEVAKIKNLATNETVSGIKSDVENLKTSKVDKEIGKGLSTNDYDNTEKAEVAKIKNKADQTYVDNNKFGIMFDLKRKINITSITSDLTGTDENKVLSQKAGNELNKKFDTIGSSRSATIVIANYDSTEKSKKGADYVVKKGEDASKVIMNAEQELVGFGGKILLMEGKYDCQSAIVLGYAETTLEGCNATLVQNENWSVTEYGEGTTSNHIIANYENMESIIVNNVKIVGQSIEDSMGITCTGSTQVSNCTVSSTGDYGITCTGSSQVSNCTINDAGNRAMACRGSSKVSNCTINDAGNRGITCNDSSQVSNCTVSSGASNEGIFCTGSSQVSNCTVSNTANVGIYCNSSSQVSNCTINTAGVGIICKDSSQVSNCTVSSGASNKGIICRDSTQVSNCTVSSSDGIYCDGLFNGICSFNVLKGGKLTDNSSPSKIEYNIIQE